ncbi:MAG: threonine synthase, partial [Bacteroidales bacterium]|nr:threonine synthase [Bacteroidales bacterium]
MKEKFYFQCTDCGKKYLKDEISYLCTICEKENNKRLPPKGVLKTIYNYDLVSSTENKENLFTKLKQNNFLDILPIYSVKSLPFLNIGNTPIYKINNLNGKDLQFRLYLKDDSQNPTFSFKDRASGLVSGFAKENGIKTIITASTGNAGSSLAGICASQNQKAIIFVPASAPIAKLTQIIMYGATIIPIKGNYDDAYDLSIKASKKFGLYNRNTAYNPLTIEGKKTVSFEIYEQLNHKIPDKIFVPVGDGVIISGVYKGFEDLLKLGLIDKMPVIVAVQSSESDNVVRNLNINNFYSIPADTIADSIAVDIPRNFYMTKKFIKNYNGEYITVSDVEILEASKILSKNTGIFAEPAAAAAFAGMLKYNKLYKLTHYSRNVVLLTGCGLKDINSMKELVHIPKAVKADIDEVKKILKI